VASGCHIETIRYYERVGLLPHPARTASGYRSYRPEEVDRLRFITRGRELRRIALELERTIASCAGGKRGQCAILGALGRRTMREGRRLSRGRARAENPAGRHSSGTTPV